MGWLGEPLVLWLFLSTMRDWRRRTEFVGTMLGLLMITSLMSAPAWGSSYGATEAEATILGCDLDHAWDLSWIWIEGG